MKLLVTGNCGFIGQNFVRMFRNSHEIIGIDKLGYAHDPNAINLCKTIKEDICNINEIKIDKDFDAIIHFGAESHVDNSISSPLPFIESNVVGTFKLLEFVRKNKIPKFIHISSDEVYGDLQFDDPPFSNLYQMKPSSPYSASKASSDLLVLAYNRTYNINSVIVRSCNNYGPYQYKEKFIPVIILNALNNRSIPLYGDGLNVREWIFVEDNCRAIMSVLENGKSGDIYNVGSGIELSNKLIIKKILRSMKKSTLVEFVEDRKGHDRRYSMCCNIRSENWNPTVSLAKGLKKTIEWYTQNPNYWE